ncbi:helix-turn-helix domain-containing protein [Rhodopseudomonas parapalustris]
MKSSAGHLRMTGDRFSASAVIDRLKEVLEVDTDMGLAAILDVCKTNISQMRSRNSVPYEAAVWASATRGVPLDYILTGGSGGDRQCWHILEAIDGVRSVARRLEDVCPASQSETEAERIAHELIHALHDAAGIAERAIQSSS